MTAKPVPSPSAGNVLDDRQRVVVDWGKVAFGAEHMADKIVRAARFFEEAAEFVQAIGLPEDHAMRAFRHVYSRPPGEPAQEAGGALNTLMAACDAIGLSLDECQQKEISRCLSKDPAHFAERNKAKLREVDTAAPAPVLVNEELVRALEDLVEIERRDSLTDPDISATDTWREQAWLNGRSALSRAKGKA